MAKKGKIERNEKRSALIRKYADRRRELGAIVRSPGASLAEKRLAMAELQSLPRDSARVRYRKRCQMTGRPRGYVGKFGISRIAFREMSLKGLIPGVRKSSW